MQSVEFLFARKDGTWYTNVVDVPDTVMPIEFEEWALGNLMVLDKYDDTVYVGVYNEDVEQD